MENITAEAPVQTSNVIETSENSTQTDSPFSCGNYCETEEVFDNKHAWKMHMLKEHLDSMKVLPRRHSRFLQEALEYKSPTSQTSWECLYKLYYGVLLVCAIVNFPQFVRLNISK